MMQDSPASMLRNSTARKIPLRSPQNDRRVARLSVPGFSVTTRKIAARESRATIGCATISSALGALFESDSILFPPASTFPIALLARRDATAASWKLREKVYSASRPLQINI